MMQVKFSYLHRQFAEVDAYLADLRELVLTGEFTLGAAVTEFEQRFAAYSGLPHAVGVGTGTDALSLSLRALGIGPGDEVITAPNTFIATVGAIVMVGARPVFVDSDDGYTIAPAGIEAALTPRTAALLPVHYTGNVADMPAIEAVARRHGLAVVEDACQAIGARWDDRPVGSWGETAGFSLHPLKNLNVWGDGGVILTRSEELAERLRLLRNHGLVNRDEVALFGANCRLDSLQAVIGNRLIAQVEFITNQRIAHAQRLDEGLGELDGCVRIPPRRANVRHVYHLYVIRVDRRDDLLAYLQAHGVEAKVHYPTPVHLQPAAAELGYGPGDFPTAEADSRECLTLPAHQHLRPDELDYVIDQVRGFYGR